MTEKNFYTKNAVLVNIKDNSNLRIAVANSDFSSSRLDIPLDRGRISGNLNIMSGIQGKLDMG
ncbi:MAG: hypothetical protein R3E60_03980 [Alphaproteobacteria bacterium]